MEHNVIECLNQLLADSYALYLKTQYHHWNIVGPNFYMLHKMLEEQYEALAEAVDTIAERIRMLGAFALGSFEEFSKLTQIKSGIQQDWQSAIQTLHADHVYMSNSLQKHIRHAEEQKDDASMDMMIQRASYHQQVAWMLLATIS